MTLTKDSERLARAEAATPAPWIVHPDARFYVHMPEAFDEDVRANRNANAEFCAAARTDIPDLIAEKRELRGLLEEAKRRVADTACSKEDHEFLDRIHQALEAK